MSEVLLIRLGSHEQDNISWMIWSQQEQEIIASGDVEGAQALNELTERAQSCRVTVLVPACDVTMRTVALPGKFNRQLAAGLPYMLEEDLAQDVDELFFAIGDKTELDGKPAVEVAIVATEVMEQWLAWLAAAQINTDMMLPDALCLPFNEDATTAIELGDQWLLRSSKWQCECVDSSWFGQYLQLCAVSHVAQKPQEPEQEQEAVPFNLISYSPCDLEVENVAITTEQPELPLQLLMGALGERKFNLRQGQYQIRKESSKLWQTWKNAAILAGVAIVLQLGYRGVTLWQLNAELDSLQAEYVKTYRQVSPRGKAQPRLIERQLKRRLEQAVGENTSGESFLALMAKVGPVISQSQGFELEMIKYDHKRNELRMNAVADGYQSFEKFKSAVEKLGLSVDQGSLNSNDDKVAGAITIGGA